MRGSCITLKLNWQLIVGKALAGWSLRALKSSAGFRRDLPEGIAQSKILFEVFHWVDLPVEQLLFGPERSIRLCCAIAATSMELYLVDVKSFPCQSQINCGAKSIS